MTKEAKICFLIPDGVGIRNYLYSDIMKDLHNSGFQLQVWHALSPEVIRQSERINSFEIDSFDLITYKEDVITQILRESIAFSRLRRGAKLTQNETIMTNWKKENLSFKKKMLLNLSEFLGKFLDNYTSILQTEKLLDSRIRGSKAYLTYKKELFEMNPQVLFCTHQRLPAASPALLAAKDLGIKTITAIFSWDNLPKARLAIRPDFYLVWSEYMAKELRFYYPEVKVEQIKITGTPQFDFYVKNDLIEDRVEFARKFGLDPGKKWICFSGDDIKTSPYDDKYLFDIAEALKNEEDIQIIFRQVPVENTARYKAVLERFPQIFHINPFWEKGKYWQQFFPYPEDISHLINLAFHCQTVINIGSTMALDFAFFDHPGLYLRYDHTQSQVWKTETIYNFQHFRSMEDLDAVGWIHSPEEILSKVKQAIYQPLTIAKDRKKWLERIVLNPKLKTSSSRIVSFIREELN
ncbi:hypothetical protein [Algoriphagus limi]|uniref:Diacylglycerol glucosyltransferase N-terminal domain-containing protein n=1 Tax=Algoriphagus limi TaxID=2975273 RepID=A0ABT2G144_9BACT|nr:hypothetical protein [Algoriphagus limi]MCS5488981.1 hypothetical protein [Algoriphagus limi]